MRNFLKPTVIIFLFINSIGYPVFSQNLNTAKLDSFFNVLSANNKTMGSFAIAKNGKIVYTRSIGFSHMNGKKKIAANKNTWYDIGSVSKLFTAVMIYQLIDEGKLSITTPLDKYYPQIPNAKDITIEQLLEHGSGLYDVTNDNEDKTWETKPHSKKEILDKIIYGKTHFSPGTQMLYNNSGYVLLGYIIEKITGYGYNENLQSRICSKIGLKHTYSALSDLDDQATGYSLGAQWEKITDVYSPNTTGADNVLSTPTDLITFDEALLNGKLISENSLKLMKTFKDEYSGKGIFRVHFFNKWAYGHNGDTYGIHSGVQSSPDDKLSIAWCINGEVYPHDTIDVAILKICYGVPYRIPSFKTFNIPKETLNQYTGVYSNAKTGIRLFITQKDSFLIMLVRQSGLSYNRRLDAVKLDEFECLPDDASIKFDINSHEMTLKQGGETYLFTKSK